MRVALVLLSPDPGGATVYVVRLAQEYQRRGIPVDVVTLRPMEERNDWLAKYGVSCQTLGMKHPYDLGVVAPLRRLLQRLGPDVIHTNHPIDAMLGNWAARSVGIPAVTTYHGTLDQFYLQKSAPLSRRLSYLRYLWAERLSGRNSSRAIAISDAVRQELIRKRICRPPRIRVVHHGVDLETFRPRPRPEGDTPVVGCVARISPEKGTLQFLQAAVAISRQLPQTRFVLVGDAKSAPEQRYFDECLAYVRESGPQVNLEAAGYAMDLPAALARMDVVVVPSLSEGFGLVVVEAMAMGKPVVASRVGGIPEAVVEGESGILVPPGDTQAMADAVMALLRDAPTRQRLGTEARRRAETAFDFRRTVDQTLQCYTEAAGS